MDIDVLVDRGIEPNLEVGWFKRVAELVLASEKVNPHTELSLVITGQEKIRQLNRDYLGKDRPTDVLAFAMVPQENEIMEVPPFVVPPDGVIHLGEVIISYPQALMQAEEYHHSVKREMAILIIHGVLHLLGYDHATPFQESRMRARELEILSQVEAD